MGGRPGGLLGGLCAKGGDWFRAGGLRRRIGAIALVIALGAASVALLSRGAATVGIGQSPATAAKSADRSAPRWAEVTWPFPVDQWGRGLAFRCAAADCGTEIKVYLRAKVGFCNCSTGVSDDMELDRIADLEVFSDQWAPLADGRPVTVGTMSGRARAYRVQMHYAAPINAISVGFNDKCDAAVATVVADRDKLATAERLALDFLNTDLVLQWAGREIGL